MKTLSLKAIEASVRYLSNRRFRTDIKTEGYKPGKWVEITRRRYSKVSMPEGEALRIVNELENGQKVIVTYQVV